METKRKKVLVTGGAGFIGHHLVAKLLEEDSIVYLVDDMSAAVINPSEIRGAVSREVIAQMIQYYDIDNDPQKPNLIHLNCHFSSPPILALLKNEDISTVYHLAAKPRVSWSVENPLVSTNENFFSVLPLLKVCADEGVRFIFSSTAAVYGNVKDLPTTEESETNPTSPYGLSKLCVEQYMKLFEDLYGLDWAALRYFNVYGPAQPGNSPYATVVSAWCYKAIAKEPLRSDGDGTQTRDMVFVDDVVSANLIVSKTKLLDKRIYNVATGKSYSNNEIRDVFVKAGYTDVVHAPVRPGDVRDTLASCKNLRQLGWEPKTEFYDGLKKVLEYWGL